MPTRELPSPELLRQLLRYEQKTGELFWLPRSVGIFNETAKRPAAHTMKNWNAKFSGKRALVSVNRDGYRHGGIFHRNFLAHRVIWAMQTERWPHLGIDHINGDRADNRWVNLRQADQQENLRNTRIYSKNKSGHTGVCWDSGAGKWRATITVSGRSIYIGIYSEIADAIEARSQAEMKHGFHQNHGRKENGNH